MRELMQKARNAMSARKAEKVAERYRQAATKQAASATSEDWDMSPEEALKASMVSGYK